MLTKLVYPLHLYWKTSSTLWDERKTHIPDREGTEVRLLAVTITAIWPCNIRRLASIAKKLLLNWGSLPEVWIELAVGRFDPRSIWKEAWFALLEGLSPWLRQNFGLWPSFFEKRNISALLKRKIFWTFKENFSIVARKIFLGIVQKIILEFSNKNKFLESFRQNFLWFFWQKFF